MNTSPSHTDPRSTPSSSRKNLWLLGWVSFFNEISSQMLYPLIPQFLLSLGASTSIIGVIEGIAEATAALFKTVSGRLSDRWGRRKPFVYAGYVLAALARPFLYVAGSWVHVLAVKFTDRLGKALRTPARDALLSTSVEARTQGRSFGIQRAMDRGGAILGPLLALLILHFAPDNLRLVFLLGSIPAVLALVFIPFIIEIRTTAKKTQTSKAQGFSFDRGFWVFLAANVVFTLGNSSNAFLILKAGESGVALGWIPLLWTLYNLFCVLSAPLFGGLSDRIGRRPVIIAAFLYYTLLYLGFAWATEAWMVWGLFAAYGLYYGLSSGVFKAYIADLVAPEERGTAYGVFHTGEGLALLPASVIMGMVWDAYGSQWSFFVAAGFSFLGLGVFLVGEVLRRNTQHHSER